MISSQAARKIKELSQKALGRIQKEGLSPTPETYQLWYIYYAGSNTDVVRAIDVLVASGQTITEERCDELYQQFLSERTENDQVRRAGDQIQETIQDVAGLVTNVTRASEKYTTDLSDATQKLSTEMSKEELEKMLVGIASRTKDMITHNKALEEKLAKSSEVMRDLQRDLEMVRREALTDSLTNLANRKAFDAEIERVKAESEENKEVFSLIMLDIDHFKNFNDDFGHQVGDQVLKLVAKTMIDGVKGRDMAARYGGEEFSVILPGTILLAGMKVAEHLRQTVSSKEIINRNSGEKLGRITLSAGVAEFTPGESIDSLIERADNALYTAKRNGRNQVAAAPAPQDKQARA